MTMTVRAVPTIVAALAAGVMFGFGLERAKMILPEIIIDQMAFRRFLMMKVFLSAVAGCMVTFALLAVTRLSTSRHIKPTRAFGLGRMRGFGANVLGGMLIGVGMTLSGSCPGTVFAQIAAGIPNAWFVLGGGLLGAVLHSLATGWLQDRHCPKHGAGEPVALDTVLRMPYAAAAVVGAIAMLVMVALLEFVWPTGTELSAVAPALRPGPPDLAAGLWSVLRWPVWYPVLAGLLMGAAQFPHVLGTQQPLGASSAYPTVANWLVRRVDRLLGSTACSWCSSVKPNWPQVATVTGIALGVLASMALAPGVSLPLRAVSPLRAAAGGLVLVFGSRLAGGCTSGHGLSGMAQLSVASVVTTAAIFAGGLLTSLVLGVVA